MDIHPTFDPGMVVELRVARVSPMGAFLDSGTGNTSDDVLLHRHQQTKPVSAGETVEVYLYEDNQGRIAASMHLPRLTVGDAGWTTVRHITPMGAFCDVGTEKDVLLPYGEMKEPRPMKGETIMVQLYTDKSGRTAATMDVEGWLHKNYVPVKDTLKKGDTVRVRPYLITERGASVLDDHMHWGIVPAGQTSHLTRGEEVEATVTRVEPDGRLSLSVAGDKAANQQTDSEKLMDVLVRRGGEMPYTDASAPEVIIDRFGMSKGAFKPAMGKLLKEGRVKQEGGWTKLLKH